MMINKLIVDTLKNLNIPVSFQKYSGDSDKYITFHKYFTDGAGYEDDEEMLTEHFIQIDVWSKSDYTSIVIEVRKLLIERGFKRLNEADLYENDTKIYHKAMQFYFLEGDD